MKKTREVIDKKLNKDGKSPQHPPLQKGAGGDLKSGGPDPLAELWSNLKTNQPIGRTADWESSYGPEETWTFVAKPRSDDYAEALAEWFSQMAEGISPLKTPKFKEVRFDQEERKIHLAWDPVPQAASYQIFYSFSYPQEPMKPVTDGRSQTSQHIIDVVSSDHTEVWLAIKAEASAGRSGEMSKPVHLALS